MTGGGEQHKELIRRLYDEVFSAGRLEVVDELMSEDYVNHDPPPGAGHSREDVQGIAARFQERIPNFRAQVERIIAEDDLVAVQGIASGSDGTAKLKLSEFFRIENGQIAERWG